MFNPGPFPVQIPPPEVRTLRENAVQMRGSSQDNIPAKYPGIQISPLQPDFFVVKGEAKRTFCDLCYYSNIGKTSTRSALHCPTSQFTEEDGGGLITCYYCRLFRRPCSWTRDSEMTSRGWTYLVFLPSLSTVLRVVGDARSEIEEIEIEELQEMAGLTMMRTRNRGGESREEGKL